VVVDLAAGTSAGFGRQDQLFRIANVLVRQAMMTSGIAPTMRWLAQAATIRLMAVAVPISCKAAQAMTG
jgi:hypothetical protein